MRKRGFNMYLERGKTGNSIFNSFSPKFKGHQETEAEVFISRNIAHTLSDNMGSYIKCMSKTIILEILNQGK